ncbi:MAG: TrpR-like protein YerC/YecD [Desulfitobacterium sp.]|nr:TrpR-like protein YerC/YecD [Desulfitobacterium sp.]
MTDDQRKELVGVDQRLIDPMIDALFDAILLLKNREECYRFFQDIATVSEIKALAQRLEVAKLLEKNITYTTIAQTTGASTATISRVKRCLHFGADGYKLILKRLAEQEETTEDKEAVSTKDEGKED